MLTPIHRPSASEAGQRAAASRAPADVIRVGGRRRIDSAPRSGHLATVWQRSTNQPVTARAVKTATAQRKISTSGTQPL
jgi:hypothetical protein